MLLIVIAVVCLGLGAAGAFAFAPPSYDRGSIGITAGSTLEDGGVVPVLAALRSTVVVLDDDDEVLRASSAAYTFNIVRDDEVCEPRVAEMVARVRAGGDPEDAELTVARGRVDGAGHFYLYVRVAAIGRGRILVLIDDRTAAKRLEDMRRDFVANVSHELKTPVGAIALLAETVEGAVDDPGLVRNYIGRIRKESARLGVLVEEIIELSRLQEGDALVEPDDVDLDAVVAEAIDRVRTEAESKEVTLVAGGTPGLHVRGDAALVTTAVRNLLDNAIRYSGPRTRVSVGLSVDEAGGSGVAGATDGTDRADGADGTGVLTGLTVLTAPTRAVHRRPRRSRPAISWCASPSSTRVLESPRRRRSGFSSASTASTKRVRGPPAARAWGCRSSSTWPPTTAARWSCGPPRGAAPPSPLSCRG